MEGGVLVVVAGLGGDRNDGCYENEEKGVDERHDVNPESCRGDFGVSERS